MRFCSRGMPRCIFFVSGRCTSNWYDVLKYKFSSPVGFVPKRNPGTDYNERGLYDPFGIPQEHVLSVSEMRKIYFDVLFAANTKLIPPQSASTRVQMFHGISFRNRAIRTENLHCDYYLIVGPYMRRKFAEAILFPKDDPRVVDASLANPSEASDVRKEMAADLFYHPGQATEVAFKWLIQMLEATRKQPAPANPHPV